MTEKRITKTFVLVLLLAFGMSMHVSAQTNSVVLDASPEAANRETALLCLSRSKNFVASMQWQNAYEQADLGIAYDSSIPDLWYIKAVASSGLNRPKADIMLLLTSALDGSEWVQYNRDAARIMYADLLSDTCSWEKALSVLNQSPVLSTSDADYIRAKSYYRLGNAAQARAVVKDAKSLYPQDGRFPLLFLKSERKNVANRDVASYAASLIKTYNLWATEFPEIMLYAVDYSQSEEERVRLLKAYNAQGLHHQLYTVMALKYGIISEDTAFGEMAAFSEGGIDFEYLQEFASLLHSEKSITQTSEWLTAFAGVLFFDTNEDGIPDLSAEYKRGRASFIRYDRNQDGKSTWQANCDFGVPYALTMSEDDISVEYGVYPSLSRCEDHKNGIMYELTAETAVWTPMTITAAQLSPLSINFYIPVPKKNIPPLTERTLTSYASRIRVPNTERENSSICFNMLNGRPQSAIYYTNEQPYAFAIFSGGILRFRNVDIDNDGFYELTETYAFDSDAVRFYMTEAEEAKLASDLFGKAGMASGLYLEKTVHDINKDGRPEYFEEFLQNGSRIASWDTDSDGSWNIRSVIANGSETSQFIHPVSKEEITVVSVNKQPVSIQSARGVQKIYRDDFFENMYWIGEKQEYAVAQQVMKFFNLSPVPGVSILDIIEGKRLLAVHIGDLFFGEVFDE